MNLITVIPLSRLKVSSELSYFTAAEVPVGSIVTVPLRSKSIHAIVTKIVRAADYKSEIKSAPFEIRKLNKIKATVFFPLAFIEACRTLSDYYATTIGAVIDTLVSNSILENIPTIVPPLPAQASFITATTARAPSGREPRQSAVSDRTLAIQGDDIDRLSSWRSLIRQEFARKKSIAFYVPSIEDGETLFMALEKGISGYIFRLNSGISKKNVALTWSAIASIEHPVVLIATGSFSLVPRGDIETIVIERENSRGWIREKAPYMDMRHALEVIGRHCKQTVFVADSMLRVETLHRLDKDEIDGGSPLKWRSISSAKDSLVDMRNLIEPKRFRILSPELIELIRLNREESTHLFILTVRRGVATMTVCDDCETIVLCGHCRTPVVLHSRTVMPTASPAADDVKNFFMCHRCGERRNADENCANCGGWRLTPLGIGIDRVREEIQLQFPDLDIFKIDSDATRNKKQISEVLEKFKVKPGSVILGTELAMLHLTGRIDHVAIASMDSLFALPDFRIQEKIMYTLVRLRAQATRSMLVQTRKPEEKVFEYGLKGNISDFYRSILVERKQFSYPPYSTLIKITIEGNKDAIVHAMAMMRKKLESYELDVFPAFTSAARGNSAIHGLLKIESHAWPDPELVKILRSLPPSVSVKVNPESLL